MGDDDLELFISVAPDGGYGWVIVAVAFFGYSLVFGVLNSLFLFKFPLEDYLGATSTEVASILSAYYGCCMILGIRFDTPIFFFIFENMCFPS